MQLKALTFDTGGTVLDWHGGLVDSLSKVVLAHGQSRNWHEVANHWRRMAMKAIVGQFRPAFNMDDVHRETLVQTLEHYELGFLSDSELTEIWGAWHRLDAWPDFPKALSELKSTLPVVSFTMLPTSLVMDVSRKNGLEWDAVISCEMIGVYKPHLESYATTAKWLGLHPSEILMVACHNFDLNAAKKAGFRTAFIRRPDEWGPSGPPDPNPNMNYDIVEDGFEALVSRVKMLTRQLG